MAARLIEKPIRFGKHFRSGGYEITEIDGRILVLVFYEYNGSGLKRRYDTTYRIENSVVAALVNPLKSNGYKITSGKMLGENFRISKDGVEFTVGRKMGLKDRIGIGSFEKSIDALKSFLPDLEQVMINYRE